jgi:flagellar protein FlaJ
MIVPFSLFPNKTLLKYSKMFRAYANTFSKGIPHIEKDLKNLDSDLSAVEYFSISLFNSLVLFAIMFFLFMLLGFVSTTAKPIVTLVAFTAAFSCWGIFFTFLTVYPKLIIAQKKNDLEMSLPFALRYLLVQVSSGIPLYNAIVDIAAGKEKEVSKEFTKIIKRTNEGIGFTDAIEENAMKSTSHFYKRALLQLSNASRSGTDISSAISEVIRSITNEQRIAMKVYSSDLNVLTMMYMMLTIILPTLGIVLLVILSNFVAIMLSLPLYIILVVLIVLIQYLFLGIIEHRRPVVAV